MLYLGVGDDGPAGGPDEDPQDVGTLYGSMLRIDVREASPEQPYAIPRDNPFVTEEGARGEIWAYGLRNPWRMAFDPSTGALWLADVGEVQLEEIDIVEGGKNYGWPRLEGDRCFPPDSGCDPAGTVLPVASYGRDDGCAIIGGGVYRGSAIPSLRGAYVYGDFCTGTVWALASELDEPPVVLGEIDNALLSLGFDGEGEVYLLPFAGPIFRLVPVETP